MHGYNNLIISNKLEFLKLLKHELSITNFKIGRNKTNYVLGTNCTNVELTLKQFLFTRIINKNFNEQLLYAIANQKHSVVLALPYEWRLVLLKNGIKVSFFKSSILWYLFITKQVVAAFYQFSLIIYEELFLSFKYFPKKKYVFFCDLSINNISNIPNKKNNGILDWYSSKFKELHNIDFIAHNIKGDTPSEINKVKLFKIFSTLPPLASPIKFITISLWFVYSLFYIIITFFFGKWWNAALFSESVKAAKARIINPNKLATKYFFHNSGWIYRPLWTYEIEKKGSTSVLYFYSTNVETFKRASGNVLQANNWNLVNWPEYFVWDFYQSNFISNITSQNKNIHIVGPINFIASNVDEIFQNKFQISIFDVQPMRDSIYQSLGLDFEYYIPEICIKFLEDILYVSTLYSYHIIHKQKRDMGKKIHYKYRNAICKLKSKKNLTIIEPNVSAESIIESSIAVISLPFTSTALIGNYLNKPSIYYDPSGLIQKNDPAAHGIEIISGINELKIWFKNLNIVNNDNNN